MSLGVEMPAIIGHQWVDCRDGDDVFESQQCSDDEGAVGPRAGVGNIEVVAACFDGEGPVGLDSERKTLCCRLKEPSAAFSKFFFR